MKDDLKNIGLVLITPYPRKFRFEGVDYSRASKQLMLYGIPAYTLIMTAVFVAPAIADKVYDLKTKFKNRKK